jgi:aldose 1-epimerase
VIDSAEELHSASLTGEFTLEKDLPEALSQWPGCFRLAVTYQLSAERLRVQARVENRGPGSLPFGLGYHPYFCLPGIRDADISSHVLGANVQGLWDSIELLPTGSRSQLPPELDFRCARPIGLTQLDHVFRRPPSGVLQQNTPVAELSHPRSSARLQVCADSVFSNLVLFTPPHRQALAIEPYTCSADAANLAEKGIDTGWLEIAAGGVWDAAVEYRWTTGG